LELAWPDADGEALLDFRVRAAELVDDDGPVLRETVTLVADERKREAAVHQCGDLDSSNGIPHGSGHWS
jgi:hypothetical protein